ncbi:hypothetical protein EP331_10940 [bacterium]|nr:MAG: hypothetical protein EP331_10940 [bacterium]
MDSIFEIIVVISVIWSIYSSLTSKKKQEQQKRPRVSTTDNLFAELENLLEKKQASNEVIETEETNSSFEIPFQDNSGKSRATAKPKSSLFREKMEMKKPLLPRKPRSNHLEFHSAIDHEEHFDVGLEHHVSDSNPSHPSESTVLSETIDTETLLDPKHVREAILLNEILNKPKALQR